MPFVIFGPSGLFAFSASHEWAFTDLGYLDRLSKDLGAMIPSYPDPVRTGIYLPFDDVPRGHGSTAGAKAAGSSGADGCSSFSSGFKTTGSPGVTSLHYAVNWPARPGRAQPCAYLGSRSTAKRDVCHAAPLVRGSSQQLVAQRGRVSAGPPARAACRAGRGVTPWT
jgi:hypothetical protein